MKSVIFLDIDGVLALRVPPPVSVPFRHSRGRFPAQPPIHSSRRVLVPHCIGALNTITAASGAGLVVSSSWRLRGDVRPVLRNAGVRGTFHEDWRTDDAGPNRGAEISRWLAGHGYPTFLVIDDWLPGLEGLRGNLLFVDWRCGLQAGQVDAAVARLRA
ncbi:HAD domain-containing protein [Pseudoroseomonas cervicalis]|uniref:HAD domain-containing protein n=1 Tax=Teichococcus cervicalis TaxID=204525 RepID=UPI00145DF08C